MSHQVFFSFDSFHKLLKQISLDQLEVEFRAQIESVLRTGLKPAHLDWHAIRLNGQSSLFELMFRLAREYELAFCIFGSPFIHKVQSLGLPFNDHYVLDSYLLYPVDKARRYAEMLHELPAGLSEWAVHPGIDNSELLAMEPDGYHFRQTDFDFWTSQQAKELIKSEGIILINYRALQAVWKGK